MEYAYGSDASLVEALARATRNCNMCPDCNLNPIYPEVDAEALEAVLSRPSAEDPIRDRWVTFTTEDCAITVDADAIRIKPLDC